MTRAAIPLPEPASRRIDNARGALWMLSSALAATVMTLAIRVLSETMPSPMIAFLRASLGLLVLLPLLVDGRLFGLRFTRWDLHLARGLLMGISLNGGFYAIATLPLTTATILFFLAPVFATAWAGPFFGERVGPWRWGAVGAGFIGALIILRPGFGELEWGMLAAILSAMCFSISLLLSKKLVPVDGPTAVLASSTAVAALTILPFAIPVWAPPENWLAWAWVAVVVATSSVRMYSDIQAYAIGEAGFIAPFAYLRLIFIAIVGWAVFSETPDGPTLLGGAVIVAATLFIAHRERVRGRAPSPLA